MPQHSKDQVYLHRSHYPMMNNFSISLICNHCLFLVQSCADWAQRWETCAVELQEELNVPAWFSHLNDRSERTALQPSSLHMESINKQSVCLGSSLSHWCWHVIFYKPVISRYNFLFQIWWNKISLLQNYRA